VSSDFCIEGIPALDEETCYVLPHERARELLIYFHGIVPPEKTSRQKTNLETALKNSAERAGIAVLLPRGEQGLAPKGHTGWWGWPTSGETYARWTPRLLEKVATKRHELEALIGQPFERSYVAGSSSGAYFTIALALNGDIRADGFGAISGAVDRARDFARVPPKPFYIGYGTRDTVGPAAQSLGARLRRAGWPVEVAAHPLPHGTAEIYIDEAISFWRSAR
jgi:predicted esterase